MVLMQGIPIREIICGGYHTIILKENDDLSDLEVIIRVNSD